MTAGTSVDYNAMSDGDFRAMLRSFFELHYPEKLRHVPRRLHWPEIKDWYATLSRRGWIAPNWPVEYGGMGLAPARQIAFIEEQEKHGVARTPDHGIVMVGPVLIRYGTSTQRELLLPQILSGAHRWCQGYSEPDSGSDLVSLRTDAVQDGQDFVVNGRKIWTTLAMDATHIFVLARTDKNAKPQRGISFLLVDLASPGISVRPIRDIGGHEEFCEVLFEDVRVPAGNLVGALNNGWTVAKSLLAFERIYLGSPKLSGHALERLRSLAQALGSFSDPLFNDRFTELEMDIADLAADYGAYVAQVARGGVLGDDVSHLKIWNTETYQRVAQLMCDISGEHAMVEGEQSHGAWRGDVLATYYSSRPPTIAGGSSEIQRNIIARSVLGLPNE